MQQKLIEDEKLFTKRTEDVFTTELVVCPRCCFAFASKHDLEIVVCPCCGFAFASKHDLRDSTGFYECSTCAESELMEENRRLKRKAERYEKALKEILELDKHHKWNLYGLAYSIAEKALVGDRGDEVAAGGFKSRRKNILDNQEIP